MRKKGLENFLGVLRGLGKFFHVVFYQISWGGSRRDARGAPVSARVGYMQYIHARTRVPKFSAIENFFHEKLGPNFSDGHNNFDNSSKLAQKRKIYLESTHTIDLLFLALCELLCEA